MNSGDTKLESGAVGDISSDKEHVKKKKRKHCSALDLLSFKHALELLNAEIKDFDGNPLRY